jgi:hypothetical protein
MDQKYVFAMLIAALAVGGILVGFDRLQSGDDIGSVGGEFKGEINETNQKEIPEATEVPDVDVIAEPAQDLQTPEESVAEETETPVFQEPLPTLPPTLSPTNPPQPELPIEDVATEDEPVVSGGGSTSGGGDDDVPGDWKLTEGVVSEFGTQAFTGGGDFDDGQYSIRIHMTEHDSYTGEIVYTGQYSLNGLDVTGTGEARIYVRGEQLGQTTSDIISGKMDPDSKKIEGTITSDRGFHSGGEGMTFEFTLESS